MLETGIGSFILTLPISVAFISYFWIMINIFIEMNCTLLANKVSCYILFRCFYFNFSGMLHTGFDAPLESLEMECIKICQNKIFPVVDKLKIPMDKCGTVLVAWTDQEVRRSLLY